MYLTRAKALVFEGMRDWVQVTSCNQKRQRWLHICWPVHVSDEAARVCEPQQTDEAHAGKVASGTDACSYVELSPPPPHPLGPISGGDSEGTSE